MLTWLLVFGVGGCWSGYTDAAIIKAPDRESAMSAGIRIAWQETAEQRGVSRGCSCDVELIEGDVRKCALYVSRCKPGAQAIRQPCNEFPARSRAFDPRYGLHEGALARNSEIHVCLLPWCFPVRRMRCGGRL